MFGTIRKHSSWLWAIIITGTIVSFVYFFSPDARYNLSGRSSRGLGTLNGRTISNAEYIDSLNEARIRYFFRYGTFPNDKEENMNRAAFVQEEEANARLIMIEKLKDLKIEVGLDSTLQFRDELLDLVTGGKTSDHRQALDAFNKQILAPNGLSLADFARFVRHEVGVMHMINLAGTAGRLIPPTEAEKIYRRENQEITVELVTFPTSNYLSKVTTYPVVELQKFYTNNMASYRKPEQVQVSYICVPLTNFHELADQTLAKITNLNQQITAMYNQQGTNYFKDKDDQPLSEEAAKAKIKSDIRDREASRLALKKAYEMVTALDEKPTLENLATLAAANKLSVAVSAPFNREEGPKDIKVPEKFVDAAFNLNITQPVSLSPVVGEAGAYIYGLNKRIPSEVPSMDEVMDKVKQDYRQSEAEKMARSAGTIFQTTLTNGLAQGKTFSEICLQSKQSMMVLPPFSRATSTLSNLPPGVAFYEVKRVAFSLEPKKASSLMPTANGSMIVYLRERWPIKEDEMKTKMPEFLGQLRMMRQGDSANEWFGRQRQAIQADLPKPPSKDQQKPSGTT